MRFVAVKLKSLPPRPFSECYLYYHYYYYYYYYYYILFTTFVVFCIVNWFFLFCTYVRSPGLSRLSSKLRVPAQPYTGLFVLFDRVIKIKYLSDNICLCSSLTSCNPKNTKLNTLNVHPLEVVPRYRHPQLQVGEKFSFLFILGPSILQILMFKRLFNSEYLRFNLLIKRINPLTAKLFNLNFHPLEVVSC